MSEAEHTPGPYHVEGGSIWAEATDGSNLKIATTHPVMAYISVAERNANAALFAAAPDLLKALKGMIEGLVTSTPGAIHPSGLFCASCGRNSKEAVHSMACRVLIAETAIAKAEGRS